MHGGFISEPVEGDGAVYMQFLVSGDCFDTHPMFFLLQIVRVGRKMKIVNIIYWLQTTYTNPTHLEKKNYTGGRGTRFAIIRVVSIIL